MTYEEFLANEPGPKPEMTESVRQYIIQYEKSRHYPKLFGRIEARIDLLNQANQWQRERNYGAILDKFGSFFNLHKFADSVYEQAGAYLVEALAPDAFDYDDTITHDKNHVIELDLPPVACPACGSTDMRLEHLSSRDDRYSITEAAHCESCGFTPSLRVFFGKAGTRED